jgi:endonuclease/exonuclease/phosphatase family metal-dependent hydrolase
MLIVSYNIQFGCGRDGKVDLARIARTVAAADLILLQEVERHWRPAHGDQAEELASLLPGSRWVHGPAVDLDGSSIGANGRVDNKRRQVGLMILSRAPILSTRRLVLDKVPVRGKIADDAILLEAVIPTGKGGLRVYDTHLSYLSQRQRQRQVEQIRAFVQSAPLRGPVIVGDGVDPQAFRADWVELEAAALPPMPAPGIIMGDFNMTVRSPEYESLVGALDPVYGRSGGRPFRRRAHSRRPGGERRHHLPRLPRQAAETHRPRLRHRRSCRRGQARLDRRSRRRLRPSARVGGSGYLD